jgi:hypothetical protein
MGLAFTFSEHGEIPNRGIMGVDREAETLARWIGRLRDFPSLYGKAVHYVQKMEHPLPRARNDSWTRTTVSWLSERTMEMLRAGR